MKKKLTEEQKDWIESKLEEYHDTLVEQAAELRERKIEAWKSDIDKIPKADKKELRKEIDEWISQKMEEYKQSLIEEVTK